MKTFFLSLLTIVLSSAYTQSNISNFNQKSVCWLGVDFTLAKFIGAHGFTEPDQIKAHFFDEWNFLVVREPERYKIKSAFDLDSLTYFVDHLLAIHQQIDMSNYIQENSYTITQNEIQGALLKYDLTSLKEEVGISFFVETFNKNLQEAQIWVVLSEIKTKTIFFSRKIRSEPQGYGFRNYWAGAIRIAIETCGSSLKKWKKGK